ncbi:DUF1439 domain-containing protein [Herbaspirillum sp. HC18]|nr:DUF1439 domain-containing protein [Herbaspirillum sp. HC18]
MKQRYAAFVLLVVTLMLVSCATLLGPREFVIPQAKLQDAMARKFPFKNRYLEMLDVRLTNPHIALQPDTNRILASMDTAISPPFTNKSWTGNFSLSGQLRIDLARSAVVLAEPRLETFTINGLDHPLYASQVSRIGRVIAEELLNDVPLYTFRPEELRYGGTAYIPTKITTRADALVVTFEPVK